MGCIARASYRSSVHGASLLSDSLASPLASPAPDDPSGQPGAAWRGGGGLSTVQTALLGDASVRPVSFGVRVLGPVSQWRFVAAVDGLLTAFPLLRSTFSQGPAGWTRNVHEQLPTPIAFVEGDAPTLRGRFAALAAEPLDVAEGPPVRVVVGRVGPEEHVLLLRLHPVACDAASVGAVAERLGSALGGAPAPAPWRDHAVFVEAERAWLESPRAEAALAQAREELAGRSLGLPLPAESPVRSRLVASRRWSAASLTRAGSCSAPLACLLGGWWLTVADWLRRDDFALGTTVALRPAPLRDVFGPAVQCVPLAPAIARGAPLDRAIATAGAHLRRVRERAWLPLAALGGGRTALGLNANLDFCDLDRLHGAAPLSRYRKGEGFRLDGASLTEWAIPDGRPAPPHDLDLLVVKAGDHLAATLRYRGDVLDPSGARVLLDGLAGRLGLEVG